MITALISQSRGIAVFDDGTRLGLMDVRSLDTCRYDDQRRFAYLLANASDVEALEVSDLSALRRHLRLRREREELLHAALILLDSMRTNRLRAFAANTIRGSSNYSQWPWVENVLLSAPLPVEADPKTAAQLLPSHADFFEILPLVSKEVQTLRTSWFALPSHSFIGIPKEQLLGTMVRRGVLGPIILGARPSDCGPFSFALTRYSAILNATASGLIQQLKDEMPSKSLVKMDRLHRLFGSIWTLSPWRTAWLASQWSNFEARAASRAVSHLHFGHQLFSQSKLPMEAAIDSVRQQWVAKRRYSYVAPYLNYIYRLTLAPPDLSLHQANLAATKAMQASDLITRFLSARDQDLFLHGFESSDPELAKLIVRFFDASPEMHATDGSPDDVAKTTIVDRQLGFSYSSMLIESKAISRLSPFGRASSASEDWQEGGSLAGKLAEILKVHALSKVLDKNGCIVHYRWHESAGEKAEGRAKAVLLNLENKRWCRVEGEQVVLLARLSERLIADLESDLPRAECGWSSMAKLVQLFGRDRDWVNGRIGYLRRRILASGLAGAVIQKRGGDVRLNPELAAVAHPSSGHGPEDSAP